MATIESLGLHEPSALSYLLHESLIDPNARTQQYTWQVNIVCDADGKPVEEEILTTKTCVLWSRGRVLKRVFRLEEEGESIIQAILTDFSTDEGLNDRLASPSAKGEQSPPLNGHISKKRRTEPTSTDPNAQPRTSKHGGQDRPEGTSRALVVILKTQAHIFLLSGGHHVVHMPFEAASTFAAPRGLIIQRQMGGEPQGIAPSVPPNSMVSSQSDSSAFQASQSFRLPDNARNRPTLTIPVAKTPKDDLLNRSSGNPALPRVFTLTDPMCEMGLVATASSSRNLAVKRPNHGFQLLDPSEEILYMTPKDEWPSTHDTNSDSPLVLIVTINRVTSMYTIWTGRFRVHDDLIPSRRERRSFSAGTSSRRRSSRGVGPGTGATTPVVSSHTGMRESLDPTAWTSHVGTSLQEERKADPTNDLASRLGPEFEDAEVSFKTSRRVSSLLARADLAGANDRTTFSELAAGNTGNLGTHTVHRRGGSVGPYSSRASLGIPTAHNRRSSGFGDGSFLSDGNSFVDTPVDHLLEELQSGGDFDGFASLGLSESIEGLPRELLLTQIESFSAMSQRSQHSPIASIHDMQRKIFTLASPPDPSRDVNSATVHVCIPETAQSRLIVATLQVQRHRRASNHSTGHNKGSVKESETFVVDAKNIQQGTDILDACKIVDGGTTRMLLLMKGVDGIGSLTLQAPWSSHIMLDLPRKFMMFDPFTAVPFNLSTKRREGGLRRVISDMSTDFIAFQYPTYNGQVDLLDKDHKRHRVEIQLEPRHRAVKDILNVCNAILHTAGHPSESFLISWWHVLRWLNSKSDVETDTEWTALVVSLFTLAVQFVEETHTRTPVKESRRSAKLLRSSSSSSIDLQNWDSMQEQETASGGTNSTWMAGEGWRWILDQGPNQIPEHASAGRKPKSAPSVSNTGSRLPTTGGKNPFIIRCSSLARRFLHSQQGREASGPEGYLPSIIGKDSQSRQTSLGALVIGLHLYREEQKLDNSTAEGLHTSAMNLTPVLAQIGCWLGWRSWTWKEDGYYQSEMADMEQWLFEDSQISLMPIPTEPFTPPSIFAFVDEKLKRKDESRYLTILDLLSNLTGTLRSAPVGSLFWSRVSDMTPKTLALTSYFSGTDNRVSATQRVEHMLATGLTAQAVESFPDGLGASFHEQIATCQANPPSNWSPDLLALIDRDDLGISMRGEATHTAPSRSQLALTHEAYRDFHAIGNSTLDTESMTAFDASAEADRSSTTKLIFREDRRYVEASRLVNQMRPPVAECSMENDWTEPELLEAQKALVQLVTVRTLAVSSGRGMIHYSARTPLLTEKLPIPGFTLQCVMKPSNVTFSAERSSFSEEKVCWAFFHAGVSTGLAISKAAKGIDTSWIVYNKPLELNNRHAGFLLALGLNGHLKTLAKWVAFKYLTPKHTMTSIGLLLGLSASYLGTMDTLITRLLSVHVTRMLPQGAAELNLSPMTQTTGIMGIGLVYCNSQHRRMSEVMLSEIENVEQEEVSPPQEILRDEGYRLAAGFALGFINLGKGKDLRGLHDMRIVERLLSLATGAKNVNIVHILDRATAGAVVAIAIIFMKTHDEDLAAKIDIPDTVHQFDYVRPDIFLLRTVAKHLIMWDKIQPTFAWMRKSLPKAYQKRYRLDLVRRLSSEDLPFFNIVAGLCLSIGLRYAGSGSTAVRELLLFYLDHFMRICRLAAINYDAKLTRNSARNCQDVIALSAASVMAGTGDLDLFRRFRWLHGRVDAETPYGSHLAAHMAIGTLFLGGGSYTFGTSNQAIAALLCAFYPLFPMSVLDNKSHLQAFRHLWVLAAEPRCLVPRDVESHRPVSIPISLTMRNGTRQVMTVPSLLPELQTIASIRVTSPDHWPLTIDFASNPQHLLAFQQNQSIYVRRRAAYDMPGSSAFHSTLQALSDAQFVPHMSKSVTGTTLLPPWTMTAGRVPLDWVFSLKSLATLDMAERALVVPSIYASSYMSPGSRFLKSTVVDARLMLEKAYLGDDGWGMGVRDRLWQLRLLFSWLDSVDEKQQQEEDDPEASLTRIAARDNNGTSSSSSDLGSNAGEPGRTGKAMTVGPRWLRREVVEELRWRVWCTARGDGAGVSVTV